MNDTMAETGTARAGQPGAQAPAGMVAGLVDVEVAAGSVAGRLHRRLGRPNQDAVVWRRGPRGLVIVVCDGCGSGRRTEVGAELGARLWLRALADRVEAGASIEHDLFDAAGDEVLDHLAALCAALGCARGPARADLVAGHLLATTLCAVVTAERAAVHALGDGVLGLGREQRVIGPFADNQPPYLALGLLGERPTGETWIADAGVGCALLASDGAVPLVDGVAIGAGLGPPAGALDARRHGAGAEHPSWHLTDAAGADALYRSPQALTRKLALLAEDTTSIDWDGRRVERRPALLDDDTTIALARWRRP
ncbi:MAG TPA: protein phosphatase 2C domain-containing protein [Kofleriaceae bacterium]|nr:protein phosphatase 2C domain-containing protein [Kofleriaceae bacterium]